jgi:hypothetical protein
LSGVAVIIVPDGEGVKIPQHIWMLRFSWEKSALLKCFKKPERSFDLKFKNISNFAIKINISTILS